MAPGCIAVGRSVSQHLRNSSCWHLREYNEPVWFARRYRMSPSTEKTALVFITKFISVFIYREVEKSRCSSDHKSTHDSTRDLPSTSPRWTMSVCTRPLCILVRSLASSRCNCSPATRRIRCSSLRRKGLLDTGHPLHTTRNTETIFVHHVHSRRYQPIGGVVFVVANYSTSHRRYSVFAYLLLTNVHGPVNHFALSQFVPLPKHSLSVSGLSLGLQNNSLTSAQATCLVSTPLPHSAEHWTKDKRTFSISPSFLSVYRPYLGWPFRVKPRRSLLHTNVRNTRRGFAHFLRFGFIERGTDTSRRDASHCSIPNSHPTRRRTLKS